MTTLTRRFRFSASHRLASPALDDDRNREIFGKCANEHGHGHNYVLEVSVSGKPDKRTGLILSRQALDRCVAEAVIDPIDHTHLNSDFPEFTVQVPTSENVLLVVEQWLRSAWPRHFEGQPVRLERLRLEETPRNSFRTTSDDAPRSA